MAGVRWRIARYDRDPHHTHAVPSSCIACSHLPLSPESESIEAVISCSLADGKITLTLLFLHFVSLLLKPSVRDLSSALSIISAQAVCHVPTVPGPCAVGCGRLSPAFGFCCLCLRETSVGG